MTVTYTEALQEWGARQIEAQANREREAMASCYTPDALERLYPPVRVERDTVRVEFNYDRGSGGCDTCATGPDAAVVIEGLANHSWRVVRIEPDAFDFQRTVCEMGELAALLEAMAYAPSFYAP